MTEKPDQKKTVENYSKETIFGRIKEQQKLPADIVEQFMLSKGKLSQTDFAARIKV